MDPIVTPAPAAPEPRLESVRKSVAIAYVLYGISALGLFVHAIPFVGLISVTAFVAIAIDYARGGEASGTWLDSHVRWQKRTFWFGLAWNALGWVLLFTIIGIPIALAIWFFVGVWLLYRVIRGWLKLDDRKPIE